MTPWRRAAAERVAHVAAIAHLYRVTWTEGRERRHTKALTYDEALRRHQELRAAPGRYGVSLISEAQHEATVAAHARALGAL